MKEEKERKKTAPSPLPFLYFVCLLRLFHLHRNDHHTRRKSLERGVRGVEPLTLTNEIKGKDCFPSEQTLVS